MDYDRHDALLHYIYKQTTSPQPDISSGVALRIHEFPTPEFRLYPYEDISLEPFENAIKILNPVVAVKIRSAAVHAVLGELPIDQGSVYLDVNTQIQVLESMLLLPTADREQGAAFIRDERVLVVWSSSLDSIVPTCQDFEERLIKLLWRTRPSLPSAASLSIPPSPALIPSEPDIPLAGSSLSSHSPPSTSATQPTTTTANGKGYHRTWYGKKVIDPEQGLIKHEQDKRPISLYAPLYNGLAAGLALVFIAQGITSLLRSYRLDGTMIRFALVATLPLLYCVSLVSPSHFLY